MTIDEQKQVILQALSECDFVYFDNRFKLGLWMNAINQLKDEGRIRTELNEIEEQYSRLEIRLLNS